MFGVKKLRRDTHDMVAEMSSELGARIARLERALSISDDNVRWGEIFLTAKPIPPRQLTADDIVARFEELYERLGVVRKTTDAVPSKTILVPRKKG